MERVLRFMFLLSVSISFSQSLDRIEVDGKIIVDTNDVEGVTIYNTSSNKGTVTNKNGEFKIKVALNDVIEISALQFKPRTLIINNEIFKTKRLKVFLVEQINTLDQVVILPYELTGNLAVDVKEAKLIEPINFTLGNFSDYDMSDDYKSGVKNIALNNQYTNGINFVEVAKLLFGSKKNTSKVPFRLEVKPKELTDVFTHNYISTVFNIPREQVEAFIVFVQQKAIDKKLLEEENKMQLIAFLFTQSELFLKP